MRKITVDAMGQPCPIPVVMTKKALKELDGAGVVETLVDNEIAVQNLTKMAGQKGYGVKSEKMAENQYRVLMTVGELSDVDSGIAGNVSDNSNDASGQSAAGQAGNAVGQNAATGMGEETAVCLPDIRNKSTVVVVSSNQMGNGAEALGKTLMKAFLYALSQQEKLPSTILFYNSGVFMTTEDSPAIEDLRSMEAQGVEILSCGTCLNYYGLTEKLQVGGVTNMYDIVEKQMQAGRIVRP